MPKVTIITVCLNADKVIKETIESVLRLDFTDYEYLIVDGKSTDKTIEIAESFSAVFAEKGISYRIISEKDSGIYDAMNKGIKYSSGEWIVYMNAGDAFYDVDVLKKIFDGNEEEYGVIYADVVLKDENYYKKSISRPLEKMNEDMPVCHQGVYVRRCHMERFLFDTCYKIAADYDLLVRLYLAGISFRYVSCFVAVYSLDGVSEMNYMLMEKECDMLRKNNGMKSKKNIHFRLMHTALYYFLRKILKRFLPGVFYSKRRGWYSSKECV